jgi:hypothetical protein
VARKILHLFRNNLADPSTEVFDDFNAQDFARMELESSASSFESLRQENESVEHTAVEMPSVSPPHHSAHNFVLESQLPIEADDFLPAVEQSESNEPCDYLPELQELDSELDFDDYSDEYDVDVLFDSFPHEQPDDEAQNEDVELDFLADIDIDEIVDSHEEVDEQLSNDDERRLSRFERARDEANIIAMRWDLSEKEFIRLTDIFELNGWAACRIALEKQLMLGHSFNEIWLAHQLREVWRELQFTWSNGKGFTNNTADKYKLAKPFFDKRKAAIQLDKMLKQSGVDSDIVSLFRYKNPITHKAKTVYVRLAWTLALELIVLLKLNSFDDDYVLTFISQRYQQWLVDTEVYNFPVTFEIYMYAWLKTIKAEPSEGNLMLEGLTGQHELETALYDGETFNYLFGVKGGFKDSEVVIASGGWTDE